MLAVSLVVMYLNTYGFGHVYFGLTRFYMTLLVMLFTTLKTCLSANSRVVYAM